LKFTWQEESAHSVQSEGELASLLKEVDKKSGDASPIAVLTAESGSEIHIGLGHPSLSMLIYFPSGVSGYEPAGSMHSVGDTEGQDRDERQPALTFFYFTHHSEFPKWMGIPKAEAYEAVLQFFRTDGELPAGIRWEDD
jgi:hypothetical protein